MSHIFTFHAAVIAVSSNGNAFVVPEGLTVSEISVIDNELLVEDYATGDVAANKAYLAVPTGATAPTFFWFGGETTGIDMVHGAGLKVNGSVFNLNGQRVAQPTKGLYIVNGKKIIIK